MRPDIENKVLASQALIKAVYGDNHTSTLQKMAKQASTARTALGTNSALGFLKKSQVMQDAMIPRGWKLAQDMERVRRIVNPVSLSLTRDASRIGKMIEPLGKTLTTTSIGKSLSTTSIGHVALLQDTASAIQIGKIARQNKMLGQNMLKSITPIVGATQRIANAFKPLSESLITKSAFPEPVALRLLQQTKQVGLALEAVKLNTVTFDAISPIFKDIEAITNLRTNASLAALSKNQIDSFPTTLLAETIKDIVQEAKGANDTQQRSFSRSEIISLVSLFFTLVGLFVSISLHYISKQDAEQARQEEEVFRLELKTELAAVKTELEQIREQGGDNADRLISVLNENSDANLELQQQIIGLMEEENLAAKKKQRDETTTTPPPLEQSKEN